MAASMAVVALIGAGWWTAGPRDRQGPPDRPSAAAARSERLTVSDPADFVLALESHQVELRSPSTGRTVRLVGRWAYRITNNAPVETADGRYLYVTELAQSDPAIYRYATSNDRRVRIAAGDAPSLSPDGHLLAFATGRAGNLLAIRTLSTGHTRYVDLATKVGSKFSLLNEGSAIVWLGNDHDLAVVPGVDGIATGADAAAATAGCDRVGNEQCIITVDLDQARAAEAARIERTPSFTGAPVGAGSTPGTILVGQFTKDGAAVETIDVAGRAARIEDSIPLGSGTLAMAFDPAGRKVLFLKGSGPIALWISSLSDGRLVGTHRLLRNVQLDAVGW
jgi:hypothetical protein